MSGLKPRMFCTKRVRKKNMPNIAAARQNIIANEPDRLRSVNSHNGVIGCLDRRSTAKKIASRTRAAVKAPMVTGSRQPSCAARMKPYTSEPMPSVDVSAPARSNRPGWRSDSLM